MNFPTPTEFNTLPWSDIQPWFDALAGRELTAENAPEWLSEWSRLRELLTERAARVRVATVQDTTDEAAEAAFKDYLANIYPHSQKANNTLTKKLLASGLSVAGMELPIKKMQIEADLFREENLPLQASEYENALAFNKIAGAQTIQWGEDETTVTAISPDYEASDRATRAEIWGLVDAREEQDRDAINALWAEVMEIRAKITANAGYPNDYRSYAWLDRERISYTPADCLAFHEAIEKTVVPLAKRIYEKHRLDLEVDAIRPWDLDLYQLTFPVSKDDLRPYKDEAELVTRGAAIFRAVDPALGDYFDQMRSEGLIDFANRKGKGPGAFCTSYEAIHRPFIFGNAVGQSRDVNTLLHEAGHAFHGFETYKLPYSQQRWSSMEFAEVASTAMEFLGSAYLTREHGGFYTEQDAARARIKHLEKTVLFWPYMAVVDAFQHWVYENHPAATNPENCDAKWAELWERFIPSINWDGWEHAKTRGWHRKRHIHRAPFYYIEYGLAALGAVQIWGNALQDQQGAVKSYLHALSLGGTVSTPELYAAAGGKFAFDAATVGEAVNLIERVMDELEMVV